jgi:hypothetical protein
MVDQPKGMAQVLEERGLMRPRLVGKCADCRMSEAKKSKIEAEVRRRLEEDGEASPNWNEPVLALASIRTDCCMTQILSLQMDFLSEKSQIEMTIEAAGHQCLFLPKFHCELNPIEMLWGAGKRGE